MELPKLPLKGTLDSRTIFKQRKSQPFLPSPHTHGSSSPRRRTPCSHSVCVSVCVCERERERECEREVDQIKSEGGCLYKQTWETLHHLSHGGMCVCVRERERREEGAHNGLDFCLLVKKKK